MNYSVFLSKCASEGPAVSDPDEQLQDLVAEEGNEEQDVWSRLFFLHCSLTAPSHDSAHAGAANTDVFMIMIK